MKIERIFEQPNRNTFDIIGIRRWMQPYIDASIVSVDPFARQQTWATHNNDINPDMPTQHHLHSHDFLRLLKDDGVKADLVVLDPPYSLTQMKQIYEGMGREIDMRESLRFYGDLRDAVTDICTAGATVLSFGWNSIGMTKRRGYKIESILLVCHGRAHNDTICVADKRLQKPLF